MSWRATRISMWNGLERSDSGWIELNLDCYGIETVVPRLAHHWAVVRAPSRSVACRGNRG